MNKIPLNLAIVTAVVAFPLSVYLTESAQAASVTVIGTENSNSNLGSVNLEPPSLPNSNQSGNFFIIPSNPSGGFSVNSGGSSSSIPVSYLSSNSSGGSSSTSPNTVFSTPFSSGENGLTASDFLAQAHIFAEYQIGFTPNGIGPVKTREYAVLDPDVLKGVPLSKNLLYSLDDISVVYEGIGLVSGFSNVTNIQYEDPNSVLKNTSSNFNPIASGPEISADFKPKGKNVGGVAIGNLAKVMDYSHFNWLQEILNIPKGVAVQNSAGTVYVENGNILQRPLFDPVPNGQAVCSYVYVPIGGDQKICPPPNQTDTLDYYYDVPGYGGGYTNILTHISEFTVDFYDRPKFSVIIQSGDEFLVKTYLVGVKNNLSQYDFLGNNFSFLWKSNYGCANWLCLSHSGGVGVLQYNPSFDEYFNSLGLTEEYFTGGVEILAINGVPVPNSTPSVTNSQSVPEPSNLIGLLGIGIALRFGTKRKMI